MLPRHFARARTTPCASVARVAKLESILLIGAQGRLKQNVPTAMMQRAWHAQALEARAQSAIQVLVCTNKPASKPAQVAHTYTPMQNWAECAPNAMVRVKRAKAHWSETVRLGAKFRRGCLSPSWEQMQLPGQYLGRVDPHATTNSSIPTKLPSRAMATRLRRKFAPHATSVVLRAGMLQRTA